MHPLHRRSLDATSVLAGRTRRDYNLAPYWQGADRSSIQRLPVQSGGPESVSVIDAAVNRDWSGPREHLVLAYETGAERSRLGMKFDHRLFDARGAEAFIGLIQEGWKRRDERPATGEIEPSPARLDDWSSKFRAGRRTNQAFQWLGQNAPPVHLELPADLKGRPFRFRHACFDEGQSKFSYVGGSAFTHDEFLGAHVRNIIHTPRVPVPPGLGLFFTQHRGRMNAVLTYVEGILDGSDADEIMCSLASTLGVQ